MSKLALQLIQEAKRTKSKILDLGNCGLTELPDELFELVWLEELYLSNGWKYDLGSKTEIKFNTQSKGNVNKISYLPPTISSLKELKILVIHGYKPTSVKDLRPLNSLVNLEQIDIKGNSVKNLTPLKGLKKLHFLNIAGTLVSSLNPLRGLKKLHFLNIAETRVRDLSSLNNLIKIETLGVGGCKIKNIKACENKINLRRLYLWKTQITDLNDLKKLNNLRELIIHNTKISDLSPLQDLYNLQELSASQTQVRDLSPLQNLSNLQRLFVHQTQVSDLRPLKKMIEKGIAVKWESYFSDEKKIIVKDCPLTNPPIEIVKQGNKAILNYWKQIEEQGGTEIINEAKLIIVGEGKTGKTTLFNKLINPTFDLYETPTAETQGINIHENLAIKDGFRANLWDFGGQELQYMTHQFFLTPNSVYVLMMDARAESPNLAYWFKIISLLGKDKSGDKVSLIIVLNKKKKSTGMPQYQDLLRLYVHDFDYQFIEVDLAVNDMRWETLKEAIEQRLINLPIVKNKLPKQWNPIRESLREAAQKDPYINASRLHTLCAPLKVTTEADQFLLTEYLHQLGSVLHFQNEEDNLMDLIVLSPEWVVEGVYTVFKSERIREKLKGKFSKKDMTEVLRANCYQMDNKEKNYTRVDAEKLLQLMSKNNFDICYKSRSGKYVAAQLLPDNRPSGFKWHKGNNVTLQFRYQYPIMPKGLMSRLIVRLSEYLEVIDGQEMVWKKGVILNIKRDGSFCRVYMREEDGETKTGLRQIVIEVLENQAPYQNRKYALQRVRQEIESLHERWFKNINSEQIIPCNCEECMYSDEPFTYELSELNKLKKGFAFCYNSEVRVPLQQLLEGVYELREIQSFAQIKVENALVWNNVVKK